MDMVRMIPDEDDIDQYQELLKETGKKRSQRWSE